MPTHLSRLLKLQRSIHLSLEREAKALLGETPASIRRYKTEYEADFRAGRMSVSSKEDLIEEIRSHDVSFIADFHTFQQAQRTALRLIREACRPGEEWTIGLELIPSRFQPALDEFQAGRISLDDFHELIRYREEWGFPWQNYAPIFEWARQNRIRLLALNLPKEFSGLTRSAADLHERDRWAAGLITDQFSLRAGLKMIVLYGELHVASAHLPRQLELISGRFFGKRRRPIQSLIIHQNHDGLYWKLARQRREHEANVVRLRRDMYCVFSSTPWNKLQSLVSWAESGVAAASAASEGWDEGDEPDYHAMLDTCGRAVSLLLGCRPPAFEGLNVRTIDQAEFLDDLLESRELPGFERRLVRDRVARNRRLYVPGANVAYIGAPSPNRAAELAASHLLYSSLPAHSLRIQHRSDFSRWVLENAFAYFGSLVLNPRRKCDLPADHRRVLAQLKRDRVIDRTERDEAIRARSLALELLSRERKSVRRNALDSPLLDRELRKGDLRSAVVLLEAARFAGRVLGKRTHQALVDGDLKPDRVRDLYLTRAKDWEKRYLEILKAVAPAKLGPSKRDVI